MAGEPKISERLKAWVDSETRSRGRSLVQLERIRPQKVKAGLLSALIAADEPHSIEVLVSLVGTKFSYDCDCPIAEDGRICEHIYGAVLLAESMGVEGFRRRKVRQRGSSESPSEGDGESEPEHGPNAGQPGRVAGIEVEGLDADQISLRVALVQWWRRQDGSLDLRSLGWDGLENSDIDALTSQTLETLVGLPMAPGSELGETYSTRRDALHSGKSVVVTPPSEAQVIAAVVHTGRAVRAGFNADSLLRWSGKTYRLVLRPKRSPDRTGPGNHGWCVAGVLRCGAEEIPVETVDAVTPGGLLRRGEALSVLRPGELAEVAVEARRSGKRVLSETGMREYLIRIWALPNPPEVDLPEELEPTPRRIMPRGRYVLKPATKNHLHGQLLYVYGSKAVEKGDPSSTVLDEEQWQVTERQAAGERELRQQLAEVLGTLLEDDRLPREDLPQAFALLQAAGFEVWFEQRRLRRPQEFHLEVSTGIDWFEVQGVHDFGDGMELSLPELLRALEEQKALREWEGTVTLADGSLGILPHSWASRLARLGELGAADGDAVRFERNQAVWLDHLLNSLHEDKEYATTRCDEAFQRVRANLLEGSNPEPADPLPTFRGTLRPYQRQGLGWLRFLADMQFGGILADDMGLGKTIQVLAHLQHRRAEAETPALVVAPRSVIHQWKAEANHFVPEITVHSHVGAQRSSDLAGLQDADLVVTSYGVLLRDVERLAEIPWDLLVLDEAQVVKNANTATARAVRRLSARQRLVVTGTPVENHLGELANHLDFLNPGLFGASSALRKRFSRNLDEEDARELSRTLQPLLLRRTKGQVAKELPERIEQDLICEMEGEQERLYTELRKHFSTKLLPKARGQRPAPLQTQVLEALLRLRQTACHPALVDPQHRRVPSAKFEVLLPRLEELIDEGSKALVFSQFTTLLDLLKGELEVRGIVYESLDGSTINREERVRRFQEDPEVPLFLISLKAGGVGLNLTAAQYVFLLDPGWNPAVEAQAIDRAHRHGQKHQVVAFRLLARGTVEEKIRDLQARKRTLAEAVLGGDGSVLRALSPEDLEALLGS